MKFYITTLGCKVNQAESSGIAQELTRLGLTETAHPEEADAVIVNSCAVTAESVRKVRQVMRSLRRKAPQAKLCLTGCLPQSAPDASFPEADCVTGTKNRETLTAWLAEIRAGASEPLQEILPFQKGDSFSALPCANTGRTRAFLKIQDGCEQYCSYCIIPFARGRFRSMPLARLRTEVQTLAEQEFREIVLTGINLGFFGIDSGESLAEAVRICAETPGVLRVRLGSLEPERMSAEILRAFARFPQFCPQFHLSLQSGSDAVLKRMNRRYDSAQYRALAEEIRRLFPEAALTTDVIVGFPGETEAEFSETVQFVRETGFAKMHVFPYSLREGTRAARMPDQIPPEIKQKRAAEMQAVAQELQQKHFSALVGKRLPVLVETVKQQNAQSFCEGHAPDGTLVKIFLNNPEKGLRNSLIYATIEGYGDDAVTGVPDSEIS